jgi:thiol-disulfide isomerase/thioredoxin
MLLHTVVILLVVAVVVEAFVLLALMRQVGTVLRHVRPPRPGSQFGGPERGTVLDVPDFIEGERAVLVFTAPNCPSCKSLEPALRPVAEHYDLELVPILVGGSDEQRDQYARSLEVPARTDLSHLYDEWTIPGTPFAIGVDPAGKVVESGIVNDLDQLEALAGHVMSSDEWVAEVVEMDPYAREPTMNHDKEVQYGR